MTNDGELLAENDMEFHVRGATMEKVRLEAVWRLWIVLCSKSLEVSEAERSPDRAGV